MIVQQFVGYIKSAAILQYGNAEPWARLWAQKATTAERAGNKLVVFEISDNDLPFDFRGTELDGSYSEMIMPPG